ncbi:hypothetical protein [Microbacterium saperdae]|uniref:Uncharacterized protein n=1 Tax=Microbacterium saperdae TaxID=69368 RepID=A0A543BAA6_9MICO|nr:hypothetical protein [Microbacterium saperdae]TQL81726.1 hypothetical protein FB560_3201 [Microbacterium saperdae]GGM34364.1 hypothetical protein GCM10010489_01370 [Microbacterium saperdae]
MDAVDEELRTLRARAYGPHADIANDPAAVRRLDELEALRSAHRSESMISDAAPPVVADVAPEAVRMPDAPAPGISEGLSDLDALFPAAEHPAPAAETTAPREPTGPRRYRRRTLWIVSATAAALAAGLTYAVVSFAPVSASSGAPQIATLTPTPEVEIPVGFIGAVEDAVAFEFHGLTLFVGGGFSGMGDEEGACLLAIDSGSVPTEDLETSGWSADGPIYNGCSVGAFPATVEIPLTVDAPKELRAAFPDGTALQFVLDGDRVGVFLDSE